MKWERVHSLSEPVQWIGLAATKFSLYREFVNRKVPGICGAYTAGVLTHLTLESLQLPLLEVAVLIEEFEQTIEQRLPYKGSYFWDVQYGLNHYWKQYGYRSRFVNLTERVVPQLVPQGQSVIVGTSRLLGSPYGNHWLVVYAYAQDSTGKIWYKAYDNHGNSEAIIPAVQTLGAIWLEQAIRQNDKKSVKISMNYTRKKES